MRPGRLFGTDGIRDRAGTGWLAPEALHGLGRALGAVLREGALADHGRTSRAGPRAGSVLVGHDGRASAGAIRDGMGRGLRETGWTIVDTGLVTTPALAFLTNQCGFSAGIMVSASHNPAEDNGIKVFGPAGRKLEDAEEDRVEELVRSPAPPTAPAGATAPTQEQDLSDVYVRHLVEGRFRSLRLEGTAVAVDCANGGASRLAPRVLSALGATMHARHASPDGTNINAGCGALHPENLAEVVRAEGAALGFCLDGDGDRVVLVDEKGSTVDGDGILTALGRDLLARGALPGRTLVATVMSNLGLERAIEEAGGRVLRTPVGDRAVVKAMAEGGFVLGGEPSGHVVFGAEHHHIGDGLFTGLRVLELMQATGRPLSELAAPFQPFPQVLHNVAVRSRPPLETLPRFQKALAGVRDALGTRGRVVVRYSGTEDLCRIMIEGEDAQRIRTMALALGRAVEESLA